MIQWVRDWFRAAGEIDVRRAKEASAAASISKGPASGYRVAGRAVRCTHCGGEEFFASSINISSSSAAFWNVEWLGDSATGLKCSACGMIALFSTLPEAVAREGTAAVT